MQGSGFRGHGEDAAHKVYTLRVYEACTYIRCMHHVYRRVWYLRVSSLRALIHACILYEPRLGLVPA